MTTKLALVVVVIAAGVLAVCAAVGVFAQIPSTVTMTIDASKTYSHTDPSNTLVSQFAVNASCPRNHSFVGWRNYNQGWNGAGSELWNGFRFYLAIRADDNQRYNIWIVGSAVETNVSNSIRLGMDCQNDSNSNTYPRSWTLNIVINVTGSIPAHRASESAYHGHHHTDGKHPDAASATHSHEAVVHEHSSVPTHTHPASARLIAAELLAGEYACKQNPSAFWDTTKRNPHATQLVGNRTLLKVPEAVRHHCCVPTEPSDTLEQCFMTSEQRASFIAPLPPAPAPEAGGVPTSPKED